MPFTIPNDVPGGSVKQRAQATPDSVDIDILIAGHNLTGVQSGCAVTPQGSPNMTVAVAVGVVLSAGASAAVTAGNVTITTADATNPRFDLIVASSAGVKSAVAGTPSASPVFPAVPADSVALAAIYVAAGATFVATADIVDKRVVLSNAPYETAERTRALFWPGEGRSVALDTEPQFLVRGMNLGIGPATIDTAAFWTTAYDFAGHIQPNIDRAVKYGANTIRIQGNWTAYNANNAQYRTRFQQVISYCFAQGLRVLYAWFNRYDDAGLVSTNRALYAAMAADLGAIYAGNKLWLGHDAGNEMDYTSADIKTLVSNFITDLKAVDPTAKCTASVAGVGTGLATTAVAAWQATGSLDFHDLHIYTPPWADSFHSNWLDEIKGLTGLPILIGEFGANFSATGALPNLPEAYQHAQYLASLRRYAADPDIMGMIVWQVQDDTAASAFGVVDAAAAPRQALAEWLAYPKEKFAAARDAVNHRTSPVILDNFSRADSATVLGSAPLGGAWTAGLGTWGIATKLGYVATGDAAGHNVAVIDANAADVIVEAEMTLTATYNAGIIYRYSDSTHWCLLQVSSAGSGTIKLFENNGGSFATVLTVTSLAMYYGARLRIVARGTTIYVFAGDHFLGRFTGRTFNQTATKHGLYRWTGATPDGGVRFYRYSNQISVRNY